MKAILDTASGIMTIPMSAVLNLKKAFPEVSTTRIMDLPQSVRVADSRPRHVTGMICLVRTVLHTKFEPVTQDMFALAAMSTTDDALILGCSTLEILGLDIYARS